MSVSLFPFHISTRSFKIEFSHFPNHIPSFFYQFRKEHEDLAQKKRIAQVFIYFIQLLRSILVPNIFFVHFYYLLTFYFHFILLKWIRFKHSLMLLQNFFDWTFFPQSHEKHCRYLQLDKTPLHIALECGNTDIMDFLIDKFKANIMARAKDGSTLMHLAATSSQASTAMLFLKRGVPLNMANKVKSVSTYSILELCKQSLKRLNVRFKDASHVFGSNIHF